MRFGAAKRVLRYLQGTMDNGIMYKFGRNLNLIGYSDSDWAGSIDDIKSSSGYTFLFGSSISSWLSKKWSVVTQSTAEGEYVSASKATSHFIREAQEKGEIQLHYCQTGEQISDIFTKDLSRKKICYLLEHIGVISQMH